MASFISENVQSAMAQSLPIKQLYQYNVDPLEALIECVDPLDEVHENLCNKYNHVNLPGRQTGLDRSKLLCDICSEKYADVCPAVSLSGEESAIKLCDCCSSFNVAWTCMERQSDGCKMEFSDDEACEDYHDQQSSPDDPEVFGVHYMMSARTFRVRSAYVSRGLIMVLVLGWISGTVGMSPDQELFVQLKHYEYNFYAQVIHTLAWFLLAGTIVLKVAQIMECARTFLINFNMNCVKFAAWVPTEYTNCKEAWKGEYHGTKGWMLREYLEMKAHLVSLKETYQRMAMISLVVQSSMSVIAMLFIPLMWCFGRSETKRYEYRSEGLMKNGFKLGQMFKGFCALMALGFLFFGNKKKAGACKEYWSYMFCNEDAWGFLRNIKRWFQGKEGNIKVPRSFDTDEVREATNVAERGFGSAEIPNNYDEQEIKDAERRKAEGKKPEKPLPKVRCPECNRACALTGVMRHPKYVQLCVGCKTRWLNSDVYKATQQAAKVNEFEATKRALGEELWSDMEDDDTVTDLAHELHLDVVVEANKEHAATGTDLREEANIVVEEIQATDIMQRQMNKNKVEMKAPVVADVEQIDALGFSQMIIHLETLKIHDQSYMGKANRWYNNCKEYFMNRVKWTHPTLTPTEFSAYLTRLRNYVTLKPSEEIDEQRRLLLTEAKASSMDPRTLQHVKNVAESFMKVQGEALEQARTVSAIKQVVCQKAGKPMKPMEIFDQYRRDTVIFAEASDARQDAKATASPPDEEIKEEKAKSEGVVETILENVLAVITECVTLRKTIHWLVLTEVKIRYGYLDSMVLNETEVAHWTAEIEQTCLTAKKRWETIHGVACFLVGFVGTTLVLNALNAKPQEEVLEGDHRKGSNHSKAKNNRHKKKVRGTKFWDIFKGSSSGNIEAEDMIQVLSNDGQVIEELPYAEFTNELDRTGGRYYEPDSAGRIPFRVRETGYSGYAIRREGFVNEGFKAKVDKQREEIIKTKVSKRPRFVRREKAIANLKQLKKQFKKRGVCKVCMLEHKGACKYEKFGVTDSVVDNLKVVHDSYVAEGILSGNNFLNSEDFNGRVGKCYVEGQFKMNCYLQGDRVIVWKHALGETSEECDLFKDTKVAQTSVAFKFPSVTLKPKSGFVQFDQIDDFIVFPVQVAQKLNAVPLRKPKVCETFGMFAYLDNSPKPNFTQGVAGINGHHSGSTTYGFCVAPLMSLQDKNIIGWHCAGGERSNRFIPVTDEILEFLRKPLN